MRLSRRAAAGILLTGASVLIIGNFFATEALAARKRSPSKSYFATLQRNDGEESESETRDNTSDLTVCLHFFVATRR